MINIAGPRGSGKTTQLFQKARELNAMILTTNSRALREKANSLGYNDIEINGLGNLKNDDYSLAKPALVDNGDIFLASLLEKYYGIEVIGISVTNEDEKRN